MKLSPKYDSFCLENIETGIGYCCFSYSGAFRFSYRIKEEMGTLDKDLPHMTGGCCLYAKDL